jgi:protein-S-isoprenylcysteine O-methyltransferase Ste14
MAAGDERGPADHVLGAGPQIGAPTAAYLAASWAASVRWPGPFVLTAPPVGWWYAVAAVLVVLGVVGTCRARQRMRSARQAGRLATDGPYARARHPIYSAWLYFIVPGVAAASRSWLVLLTPLVFYAAIRACIGREERKLRARFREAYDRYAARTPLLSPFVLW